MRFIENGPHIPDDLIEAQRNGQVVFFCGAGISIPAGLPSFAKLTENIAAKLHATDHDFIKTMMENNDFDRVFTWLRQQYPREQVDRYILNAVRVPRNPLTLNHANLLKLSVNPLGKSLIITTNFDRLFERAETNLKYFCAPYLPDLTADQDSSGIVYLHGRWERPDSTGRKKHNLVISSQDFGRAYLAHGWAARFLSDILKTRTIVLIGYSGDDTLVRYLLEGLSVENDDARPDIYAFERGTEGEISRKWSALGVRGIACAGHDVLWGSIDEWSRFASKPDDWENHIKGLSQQSPRILQPFERGQVASFVSNKRGAQKFASFDPLPHAEWLCVFDRYVRLATPETETLESGATVEVDPLDYFGIDRDPTRSEVDSYGNQDTSHLGEDHIGTLASWPPSELAERLSNLKFDELWRVNSRTTALCLWVTKIIDEPATIWWLFRQQSLHPLILECIGAKNFGSAGRQSTKIEKFWQLFHRCHQDKQIGWDIAIYELEKKIKSSGWHDAVMDEFEALAQPALSIKSYSHSIFPLEDQEQLEKLIPSFEVVFPRLEHMDLTFPDDWVADALAVLSRSLTKAVELTKLTELPPSWFHSFDFPTLIKDENEGDFGPYIDNFGKIILLAAQLCARLEKIDPEKLARIVANWPSSDPYIFDRLKLFVWRFEAEPATSIFPMQFTTISDEVFWDTFVEHELVETVLSRLPDLTEQQRWNIESRIWQFRNRYDLETEDTYLDRKTYTVGRRLAKIAETSSGLTDFGKERLEEIQQSERWQARYAQHEFATSGTKGGYVSTNTAIDGLNELKGDELFAEIARREEDRSEILGQNRPFIGIARHDPIGATETLLEELSRGQHRERYWRQLFENFPEGATDDQINYVGKAIVELPEGAVFECRYSIPRWLREFLVRSTLEEHSTFWNAWDHTYQMLNARGEEATQSALGEPTLAGRVIQRSRMTVNHGLNSPIGGLVEAVFKTIDVWSLENTITHFQPLLERFTLCLQAAGEGSANAAAMIGMRYNFLFYYFPSWAKENLIPIFNIEHKNAEAVWRGFTGQTQLASGGAFKAIRPALRDLISSDLEWEDEDRFGGQIAHTVVIYAYWSGGNAKYLTDLEVRKAMRSFDDDARSQALWQLWRIVKDQDAWAKLGKRFLANCWPLEKEYQSRQTTNQLLTLAAESGENFPEVVDCILPLLLPLEGESVFIHRITREKSGTSPIVTNWPESVLRVFDHIFPPTMQNVPYNLREGLEKIIEASPSMRLNPTWQRLEAICPPYA